MSRIGIKPVNLPAGVEVKVDDNNVVTVKGPKGELQEQVSKLLKIEVNGTEVLTYGEHTLDLSKPFERITKLRCQRAQITARSWKNSYKQHGNRSYRRV